MLKGRRLLNVVRIICTGCFETFVPNKKGTACGELSLLRCQNALKTFLCIEEKFG
jgi:hypothetical protein